jgi:hypothetical protein
MTFCEKAVAPKKKFEPKSFRWVQSGKSRVLIGCPRGKWRPRKMRCRVGTAAYKVLSPARGKRKACPVGTRRINKG